jgi:hypothetical protein
MDPARDLRSEAAEVSQIQDRADILTRLREDLAIGPESRQAALVQVEIDPAGTVTTVRIHRDWRKSLGPAALGEAILDGYSFAMGLRMTEVAVAALEDEASRDGVVEARRGPASEVSAPTGRQSRVTDRTSRLADLRRELQENRAQLDRLREAQNRVSADDDERQVVSPLRCFTATLTRFGIVGIEGNARVILGVPLHELQEDVVGLFELAGVGEKLGDGEER